MHVCACHFWHFVWFYLHFLCFFSIAQQRLSAKYKWIVRICRLKCTIYVHIVFPLITTRNASDKRWITRCKVNRCLRSLQEFRLKARLKIYSLAPFNRFCQYSFISFFRTELLETFTSAHHLLLCRLHRQTKINSLQIFASVKTEKVNYASKIKGTPWNLTNEIYSRICSISNILNA